MSNIKDIAVYCKGCNKFNKLSELCICTEHNKALCKCYNDNKTKQCEHCKKKFRCPDCLILVRIYGLSYEICLPCHEKISTTCAICSAQSLIDEFKWDVEGATVCTTCINIKMCANNTIKLFSVLSKCTKCDANVANKYDKFKHDLCGKCCKICDKFQCREPVYVDTHKYCGPHHKTNSMNNKANSVNLH
jgi:hypothetical protein